MLICPSCQTPLVAVEFQKVELDYCPRCRGCWFDHQELGLLLHGDPAATVAPESGPAKPGIRSCPRCGDKMNVAMFLDGKLELDVCKHRHGWWLDAGELKLLIEAKPKKRGMAALSVFCDSVLGSTLS